MQLINSTVIREFLSCNELIALSSGNFPLYFFLAAYIRELISGRLVSWGPIFEGLIYPGAYIRGHISRGLITGSLYPGDFYPGDFYRGYYIRGAYNRGANIWGLITRGSYPGLLSGELLCRGLILHTDNF